MSQITASVVGSTGMVGSFILSQLLSSSTVSSVSTVTRRALPQSGDDPKLLSTVTSDTSTWPSAFSSLIKQQSPPASVLFSGLGTTRAAAGGLEAQRKIDYDLNVAVAQAAKDAGVSTYVLISATSFMGEAKSDYLGLMAYPKMKADLEHAVRAMGFERCVILRPGLIMGKREETRYVEAAVRRLANWMPGALRYKMGVEAERIAEAAIKAAADEKVLEGVKMVEEEHKGKTWYLEHGDIVRLTKK